MNEEITYDEVKAAVVANVNGNAPGIDEILPPMPKNEACIQFLHSLYNVYFKKGIVPGTWSEAVIKPIPKVIAQSQFPGIYRGISLQSFVASRVLNGRLKSWLEENSGLCDEQNAF